MNRKQEVAAWIFGLLIALGLLVADKGIWSLVVLAGLTILSLRDRQKKKKKSITAETTPREEKATSKSEQALKHLTPHMLATAMIQRIAEGGMPFKEWRKADTQIPSKAESLIELACQFYQLRILLDLIERKFGSPIAKLVESSFVSLTEFEPTGPKFFSMVSAAIVEARVLGPAQDIAESLKALGRPDELINKMALDAQVAEQILGCVADTEENRAELRVPFAQCVSFARASAEAVFPDIVAKMDFDPASIALVRRETAYNGITSRWSDLPGCFERHLQRKEGNLLFSAAERQPSDDALEEARARDDDDVEKLKAEVSAVGETLAGYLNQEGIPGGILADLLHYKIQPLIVRSAAIGELASAQSGTLQELNEELMKSIVASHKELAEGIDAILKGQRDLSNPFLAQASREDTPIASEDFILALLCENTDTVQQIIETFSRGDTAAEAQVRGDIQAICNEAIDRATEAARQGFELPAAEEKLALLAAYSERAN